MNSVVNEQTAREGIVSYLRAQLLGPIDGPNETLTDPPRQRYLLGILFPQYAPAALLDLESDSAFGDEGLGKAGDMSDGVPDEEIRSANDWYPSSLGLSFYLVDSTSFSCELWGASYEQNTRGKSRSWTRIPIAEQNQPERHRMTAPQHSSGYTYKKVLADKIELQILWRKFRSGFLVTVTMVNAVKLDFDATGDLDDSQRAMLDASCLHQVGFRCVTPEKNIHDYPTVGDAGRDGEEEELRLLYSSISTFAIGHGSSVTWNISDSKVTQWVSTEHLPTAEVKGLDYRLDGFDKVLSISNLTTLSVVELEAELTRFIDSYEHWSNTLVSEVVPAKLAAAKTRILARIAEAITRMRNGISTLIADALILRAFRLANLAMLMQMHQYSLVTDKDATHKRDEVDLPPVDYTQLDFEWRSFQLAFQLLTIASVADDESPERDIVDLIWFPTGGGKTEAYLAIAAFAIILRRLRDPERGSGTAVITRYTLTLLTAQQFQRAATLACCCEMIRRSTSDLGTSPMSIGLWIGDRNAPNRFTTAAEKYGELLLQDEPANPFQLQQCPWCGTEIVPVEGTKNATDYGIRSTDTNFAFYCTTKSCPFHDELPVHVIDEDLYQRPPSILLATVDKFAQLPWDERPNAFFGGSKTLPPTLIIQDELHLLSGPLGTTVGLYECAIELLISLYGSKPKIIASTATIRRAGDQVLGLFGRANTSVFPPAGLSSDDSYFAKTASDKPGRLYVGIMPQSHSTQTSVVNTATALLQSVMECKLNDNERDAYWTLVAYHNSLRELGRTVTLARDDIPERIKRWASDPALERVLRDEDVMELRSNLGGDKLPKMLLRLGRPMSDSTSPGIVACTNMFSVGVDVQRLGVMLMNGQPKSTSEYIQATSRVGRGKVPGIVAVLYGATRPRDRSHYEQFLSFHSALYKRVEPTSVTPFSPPSRKRALHAVFVAVMRHWAGFAQDESAKLFEATDERSLRVKDELLKRAEITDPSERNSTSADIDRVIEQWDSLAADCRKTRKGLYFKYHGKQFRNLLSNFGRSQGLWPTLQSMRNVDDEVDLFVLGATNGQN